MGKMQNTAAQAIIFPTYNTCIRIKCILAVGVIDSIVKTKYIALHIYVNKWNENVKFPTI